jgi:TolB-like protein/Tfp pilus assembly protein PilF
MFTDIVGYTALTQRNEALALEILTEHRELLRGLFPRFNGHEIETIGDGFLVEFASALEAARCAVEIQRRLTSRNLDVPSERQIHLRIGIHVGDVVHRDGKVMGDGVNIAARLQPLAEPGGICISVDVAHQVQHNLEARVIPLGAKALKNVSEPLEVCRIVLPWERKPGATGGARPGAHRRSPVRAILAVGLAFGFGGLVFWFVWPRLSLPSPPAGSASPGLSQSKKGPVPDYRSVGVLPFSNIGPDQEDEYLSDGLTEELINALVRLPGLRVPARTSAFAFKGKNEDVRSIAKSLNVTTVLEGSVRKSGDRIRVTAQLINAADGYHLWSETYDRAVGDLLTMQEEIARQIASKLQLDLGDNEQGNLTRRSTTNALAHELYLKGLYWWNKRTKTSLEKAAQLFQQATDEDPNFARAYAALASTHVNLPEYAFSPTIESVREVEAAARKALATEPGLAEAHAALGFAKFRSFDFKAAEGAFRRATELNPNHPTSHHWYSLFLRMHGRFDEAAAVIQRARELDPLSLVIRVNVAECYMWSGRTNLAAQELQQALDLDPDFALARYRLGVLFACSGRWSEAREEILRVRAATPEAPYGLGMLGYVLARSGDRDGAQEIVQKLDGYLKAGLAVRSELATTYLGLQDLDQTFVWLEQAYRAQEDGILKLKHSPLWKELHTDPRLEDLLARIGFGS